MAESGIDGLRIVFRFQLSFIDANQLLSFPRFFPETVVGDPIKPGRKFRFAAKTANVFVSAQKSFLREIVCQSKVGAREVPQETAHGRLMIAHQLGKGVMIIIE